MKLARREALVGLGALAFARPASARATPDLALYQAIRDEGLNRGQAMTYAASLVDGVGARLMGSPNMRRAYDWSLARLRELGLSDPRLEPIGPFGLSWRQVRARARMIAPDSAAFVAQAAPWSVATNGVIEAEVVAVQLGADEDLQREAGKLRGKIVLLNPPPATTPGTQAPIVRYTDEQVVRGDAAEAVRAYYRTVAERRARQGREGLFKARRNAFLAAEGVRAVILSSRGEPGVMAVDGSELGGRPWLTAERPAFPVLHLAGEAYGRCWRLTRGGTSVRLEMEIVTDEGDPAEPGYNVVAELPGSDAKLKAQVVLAGAHLDSWATGSGAADNARAWPPRWRPSASCEPWA